MHVDAEGCAEISGAGTETVGDGGSGGYMRRLHGGHDDAVGCNKNKDDDGAGPMCVGHPSYSIYTVPRGTTGLIQRSGAQVLLGFATWCLQFCRLRAG